MSQGNPTAGPCKSSFPAGIVSRAEFRGWGAWSLSPMRLVARAGWSAGVGWLTVLSVAAVLAINIAGLGGIAVSRRGVLEEAERVLRLETSARAIPELGHSPTIEIQNADRGVAERFFVDLELS